MIVLPDRALLLGFESKEDIAGEQRFAEDDRLAPVFMGRIVTGQRGGETLPLAILDQLLLSAGFDMGDEPREF